MTRRDFVVARPTTADAARIAEIQVAAMEPNPLLHAQFPTPESLMALREFLAADTAKRLGCPASGILVARDPATDAVVGFAKWESPSHPGDVKLESGGLQDLEGCRREYLGGYAALAEAAQKRSFGGNPCYRAS